MTSTAPTPLRTTRSSPSVNRETRRDRFRGDLIHLVSVGDHGKEEFGTMEGNVRDDVFLQLLQQHLEQVCGPQRLQHSDVESLLRRILWMHLDEMIEDVQRCVEAFLVDRRVALETREVAHKSLGNVCCNLRKTSEEEIQPRLLDPPLRQKRPSRSFRRPSNHLYISLSETATTATL